MKPFEYPVLPHRRGPDPGPYKNYRTYKPTVRAEFGRQCVYCRAPDGLSQDGSAFGIDHYRPQKLFPALTAQWDNLFYCCNPCNSRKREYWPSDGLAGDSYIPNPCDHRMGDHLRYQRATVRTRTKQGEIAEAVLDLNDPLFVSWREMVITLVSNAVSVIRGLEQDRRKVVKKLRKVTDPHMRVKLEDVSARIESELLLQRSTLQRLAVGI